MYIKVIQLNNNNILIISHTSGNTTYARPLHTTLDFRAQPIMIDMRLFQELDLTFIDL